MFWWMFGPTAVFLNICSAPYWAHVIKKKKKEANLAYFFDNPYRALFEWVITSQHQTCQKLQDARCNAVSEPINSVLQMQALDSPGHI